MTLSDWINDLANMQSESMAWKNIWRRSSEAYDYVDNHRLGTLGDNIWHIVLDDAIRMRKIQSRLIINLQSIVTSLNGISYSDAATNAVTDLRDIIRELEK